MPFDDYLVKPVAGDELRATVERLRTLAEYEQLRLELSSKRVKRNVLAAEHREDELAGSESFRALQARIAELEATLAAIETELDEAHLRAARAS
jgi:two-component system response regulator AdeR